MRRQKWGSILHKCLLRLAASRAWSTSSAPSRLLLAVGLRCEEQWKYRMALRREAVTEHIPQSLRRTRLFLSDGLMHFEDVERYQEGTNMYAVLEKKSWELRIGEEELETAESKLRVLFEYEESLTRGEEEDWEKRERWPRLASPTLLSPKTYQKRDKDVIGLHEDIKWLVRRHQAVGTKTSSGWYEDIKRLVRRYQAVGTKISSGWYEDIKRLVRRHHGTEPSGWYDSEDIKWLEANDRWVEGERPWRKAMGEVGEDRRDENANGGRKEEVSRRAVRLSVRVEQKQEEEEEEGEAQNANESSPISPWKLRWNAAIRSLERRASRVRSVKQLSHKTRCTPERQDGAEVVAGVAQAGVHAETSPPRSSSAPPSKEAERKDELREKKKKKPRTKSISPRKTKNRAELLSSREKGKQYHSKAEKQKHLKALTSPLGAAEHCLGRARLSRPMRTRRADAYL
ncbi:hypothetical protein GUITHDRAFT_142790 [Guillardia theta CCMP2712]|uniref:Helicase-associated domain-containing protein n=1 Tax=Guillardia theta (strain CCMP2712) TaxID=905079 RepID=L1IX83_GUITC|nr:hypothetical protein GUITHDRAFT_142790 [Guillardia theta CCMP2712]EKX40494.1 hypothetical protein GUITHDRAFT_142790 [Guillardia theta CCMP2712]|eukprot:XP_005827474.1 hypothetical protein GUITHDRAFT_142790 [Guillardia theta CCMP2712]